MTNEEFLKKYSTMAGSDKAIADKDKAFLYKSCTVAGAVDVIDEYCKAEEPVSPTSGATGVQGTTGVSGATGVQGTTGATSEQGSTESQESESETQSAKSAKKAAKKVVAEVTE